LIHGFKIGSQAASATDYGHGIWAQGGGQNLAYYNIEFGPINGPNGAHVASTNGGYVAAIGTDQGGGSLKITGKAASHLLASGGLIVSIGHIDLTIVGSPAIVIFANAGSLGTIQQTYNTITGSSTGSKYSASLNGIVNSNGAGVNYFPGTTAGSVNTGGQYG
jgi:hypothetical protein